MLKIRLSRTGKKAQPSYRVVVQEHTAPIKGKFIEEIGIFRPADNPKVFKVDVERIKYWISVGAQPSDTVAVLLKKEGLEGMEKYMEPRDKKRKTKKATPEAAKTQQPAAAKVAPSAPAKVEAAPAKAEEPAKVEVAPAQPEVKPEAKEEPKPEAKEEPKPEAPAVAPEAPAAESK